MSQATEYHGGLGRLALAAIMLLACAAPGAQAAAPTGADWNQWRGPNRNGVIEDGIKLADSWGPKGPPLLWKSEEFPSGNKYTAGGYSGAVFVKGKVYAYANWKNDDVYICLDAATGKTL
jgi:hypothetical protein